MESIVHARPCNERYKLPQLRLQQKGGTRIIEIPQIVPARQPKIRRKLIPQPILSRTEKLLGRVRAHATKPRRKLSPIPHVEGQPDIRDRHPHFADQVVSRCGALLLGGAAWAGDDLFVIEPAEGVFFECEGEVFSSDCQARLDFG